MDELLELKRQIELLEQKADTVRIDYAVAMLEKFFALVCLGLTARFDDCKTIRDALRACGEETIEAVTELDKHNIINYDEADDDDVYENIARLCASLSNLNGQAISNTIKRLNALKEV